MTGNGVIGKSFVVALVAALAAAIGAQGASAKTGPRHPAKQSSAYVQYSQGTIPLPGHVYVN